MRSSFKVLSLALPITSLLLMQMGCGILNILPTPATPVDTVSPVTLSSPTAAPLPPPAGTALPALLPPSPNVPTGQVAQPVKIFLVALEDNGVSGKMIGCGDSLVAVEVPVEISPSDPHRGAVRAALTELLSINSQYYGESGLYQSLYQSNLTIDEVTIENGDALIRLKGTLQMGGVCDSPRIQAQLEETARQFPLVRSVRITINDIPLEKLLSGKG